MVSFPNTRSEVESLQADIPRLPGLHYLQKPTPSIGGLVVGSVDFDPVKHPNHLIDVGNPMEEIMGLEQVRLEIPVNPLAINVVGDYRFDPKEDLRISHMKAWLVSAVVEGLGASVPNLDRDEVYSITNPELESTEEDNRELLNIFSDALTFIIGDMKSMRDIEFSDMSEVIAVKVNHPLERFIIPNVGRLPLGGLVEVDTDDPAQVQYVNEELEANHQGIVNDLESAGAHVVSVVMKPNDPEFIDQTEVDQSIAEVVKSLS